MRIVGVELTVPDPAATTRWYGEVLGLPVHGASVEIGRSTLRVVAGPPDAGHHHLAFSIPADAARDALRWLRGRVDLIPAGDAEIVVGPPSWDSESVYFRGPDGAILELIARHRLPDPAGIPVGGFGTGSLLSVSEVGVPVPDVRAAVAELGRTVGTEPFGPPGTAFAPVGDDTGLLILVAGHRAWFPTADEFPASGPLAVTVEAPPQFAGAVTVLAPGRTVTGS